RGVRQEIADFTSFYLYSLTRGLPHALRARKWPRITRFEDRWRWLVTSVVPLRPAAITRKRATVSCATQAMAPATAQRMNRSPGERLLPVARPRPRPAAGSSWHRIANWLQPATVTFHNGLRAYGRGGCAA